MAIRVLESREMNQIVGRRNISLIVDSQLPSI